MKSTTTETLQQKGREITRLYSFTLMETKVQAVEVHQSVVSKVRGIFQVKVSLITHIGAHEF